MDYDLNDIVEMKKEHPCHRSKEWKIIRMRRFLAKNGFVCTGLVHLADGAPRLAFQKRIDDSVHR